MSHKKHRKKDRSYSVNEHEPTTIQRWVNSQLKGKGKRTSQTVGKLIKLSRVTLLNTAVSTTIFLNGTHSGASHHPWLRLLIVHVVTFNTVPCLTGVVITTDACTCTHSLTKFWHNITQFLESKSTVAVIIIINNTIIIAFAELDHDITKPSKGHLHPDVFTTDSGIVTTTPRTHRGSVYDVEEAKLSVATVIFKFHLTEPVLSNVDVDDLANSCS